MDGRGLSLGLSDRLASTSSPSSHHTISSSRRISTAGIHIASPSIPVAEGFGSPQDCALTPPGVLTKLDTRIHKNVMITKSPATKFACMCCGKANQCICKKCTLEKLKFYSRREKVSKQRQEKQNLSGEVDKIFGETSSLLTETYSTRGRIELLRRAIAEKKELIDVRKLEIRRVSKGIRNATKYSTSLGEFIDKHESQENIKRNHEKKLRLRLELSLQNLAGVRRKMSLLLFNVFPVREVVAEAAATSDTRRDTADSSRWAVVDAAVAIEGHTFQIRSTYISDSSLSALSSSLPSSSTVTLSPSLRSPFAALLYSVQLINLLATIFDYRLPYMLAFREMVLCDNWTREIIDTDWFKLCKCVLNLCLHVGIDPQKLQFNYPHSNLIELARHICDGDITTPAMINSSHRVEIGDAKTKLTWGEREMNDWDILEDANL